MTSSFRKYYIYYLRYCQKYWELLQTEEMIRNSGSQITRYYLSGSKTFENISISVFEWLVILVGCKIKGINELEARESESSYV